MGIQSMAISNSPFTFRFTMQSGCQFVNAEDCNDNYEALMKYVQISALAPPAEAHLRIATALTEVNSAHNHLQDLFILCNVSSPVNYILCSSQLCIKSHNIFCFFALNSFQKKTNNSLAAVYIFVSNHSNSIQVRPYLIPDSNDLIRQVEKALCTLQR